MKKLMLIFVGGNICQTKQTKKEFGYEKSKPDRITNFVKKTVGDEVEVVAKVACYKDSNDVTDEDRIVITDLLYSGDADSAIIFHGVDTIRTTAAFIDESTPLGPVVLVGSIQPFEEKDSDAQANIEAAINFLISKPQAGVYIAEQGTVSEFAAQATVSTEEQDAE